MLNHAENIFSIGHEAVLLAREQGTLTVVRDIEVSITQSYLKPFCSSRKLCG